MNSRKQRERLVTVMGLRQKGVEGWLGHESTMVSRAIAKSGSYGKTRTLSGCT